MRRRDFLAVAGAQATGPRLLRAASRPNLLYIVVDQLSGLAMPAHDANSRLPNCQNLAKSGVQFSHAYTAGVTCGPSRASLDSGLHSQGHRVIGGEGLPASIESLPRTLARHGYVLSHPNGYKTDAERAEHEKWLAGLGYDQPLSSLYGSEKLARYLDLPLKWKCGRTGLAPEHAFDAFCAQRAIRFL